MKTEKEIEEMTDRKLEIFLNIYPQFELVNDNIPSSANDLKKKLFADFEEIFDEVYMEAQKDLLAEASEGFEEFEAKTLFICDPKSNREKTWQASRLPLMKKIEELRSVIKIKDEFMQASVCLGRLEEVQKEKEELSKVVLSQEKERQSTESFWKIKLEQIQKENEELKRELQNMSELFNTETSSNAQVVAELQKENEELREALDYTCRGLGFYTDFRGDEGKKLSSIITKFSLDKNDKGAM